MADFTTGRLLFEFANVRLANGTSTFDCAFPRDAYPPTNATTKLKVRTLPNPFATRFLTCAWHVLSMCSEFSLAMRRMRADLAFLFAVDRSRVRATRCFGEKQDITRGVQDTFHSTPNPR
jgi:hypothetical protein